MDTAFIKSVYDRSQLISDINSPNTIVSILDKFA